MVIKIAFFQQVGWMSEFGEQLDLPLTGNAESMCSHTGAIYRLSGSTVIKEQA